MAGTPSRLSLRANFSWTFLGNVIFAACQWGMLIVLAKLGTPEMVGQFALGSAIAVPVLMLTNLQLRDVQATDAREEYAFADYFGLRLITVALAMLIIGGIVLALRYPVETALVVVAFGLFKAVEAISDVIFGMLQHHERMDRVARSMILRGLLSLAALGLLVYLTGSVFWGVMGLAFAGIGVVLLYDLRSVMLIQGPTPGASSPVQLARSLRPRWRPRTLLALTWLALPLGISMLLISLVTSLPRFFVGHYLGEYTLGIFAALTYLQVAGMTVVSALGQSALPRLSRHYATGDRQAFSRLLLQMGAIGLALGAGGVVVALVAGRPLLTLIYQPEYATYTWFFVWVMVSAAIGYVSWLIGEGMKAARYLRVQVVLFGVQVVVLTALSVWLIPSMGMTGVAIVMIAASAVHLIGTVLILAHAIGALPARRRSEAR
ncbi:MAG: oligosaccharide flippase family protein [Oscillochloridaceae bacterium]|nr:oligosaccharide flippase family protein [Chloroflexaceae bacterium]MDW8389219.1 oligosaccharide flippase family protein [Oscillochloridaceae bacterium]